MPNRTRVFISYSHDSEQQLQFVLELAERLLEDGFNCVLDFYLDEAPEEGWRAWLEAELTEADFTLVICTPKYLERYQANELVASEQEAFSGLVITEAIYTAYTQQTKFVPILPEGGKLQDIIPPLQGQNALELMVDYLGLHQLLKHRPTRLMKTEPQTANWNETSPSISKPETAHNSQLATESTKPKHSTNENKLFFYLLVISVLILGALIAFLLF